MGRFVKHLASALCVLMMLSAVPSLVFADSILDPAYETALKNLDYVWNDSYGNGVVCPKCGAIISKLMQGTCAHCGFNALIDDGSETTYRPGYQTGGGSAGTGGVGRHPSGYQDSTGTPSINLDGVYIFALSHDYTYARVNAASKTSSSTEDSKYSFPVYRYCADSTLKSTFDQGTITESGDSVKYSVKFDEYEYSGYFGERFKGVAPCDGKYSLYIRPKYSISGSVFSSSYNDSVFRSSSGNLGLYGLDSYYVAGSTISIYSNVNLNYIGGYYPKSVTYQFTGVPYLKCEPTAPLYSKKTNITINNNTWNGNILIRRKLPKGQSMNTVTQEQATQIQHWLNDYPRHIFGGKTAFEMFMQELPAMNLHNQQRIIDFFNPNG